MQTFNDYGHLFDKTLNFQIVLILTCWTKCYIVLKMKKTKKKNYHIVECFPLKRRLTDSEANITPHEHTSFHPSSLCLYSLALAVGASPQLKKQFVLKQHKRFCNSLSWCLHTVCVRMILSSWHGVSVCVFVCVCLHA